MNYIFSKKKLFNPDISDWDVSSVTEMSAMFWEAKLFNGDLSKWDVSGVTDMSYMFHGAEIFNGDVSNWDVSSVTDMEAMFIRDIMLIRNHRSICNRAVPIPIELPNTAPAITSVG